MKIESIKIENNPILGNISLDFTDNYGAIVDTVIFAGENGCGKTTLLNILRDYANRNTLARDEKREYSIVIDDNMCQKLNAHIGKSYDNADYNEFKSLIITYSNHGESNETACSYFKNDDFTQKINFPALILPSKGIYLTPEILFTPSAISHTTAQNTDLYKEGIIETSKNTATEIAQLLIDISTQDALDFSATFEKNHKNDYNEEQIKPRITRFNRAFKYMLDDFRIENIKNNGNNKIVEFYNNGNIVRIDNLSSGEKQIVFRGGFLLKDKNSLNNAIVLIDEPELSLHPTWQKNILDYYKNILTNENQEQTSQLFVATHSPYIIHNDNRRNDKVIVLKKGKPDVIAMDKPEYFGCGNVEVVQDAFQSSMLNMDKETVYLEGRTDEMYFKKALEVFKIKSRFQFKWVGVVDVETGHECNTGSSALDKAYEFLRANSSVKSVCLYDSDTKQQLTTLNRIIFKKSILQYDSNNKISGGIENALMLDRINIEEFYTKSEKIKNDGGATTISSLEKMKLAEYICGLNSIELKHILFNIKKEIESLESL